MQINDIDRQAAEWAAKADGGGLSAVDHHALEAWLAADVRHVGAYAKATALLVQVERLRATGLPKNYSAQTRYALLPSRRQVVWGGAVAAGITAIAVSAHFAERYLAQEIYATGVGESKVVALADGSVVSLNTDTKVVVRYSRDRRDLVLAHGEVLFDVAKNKARPFVVTVRDVAVRAVGTSFAVRALADQPVHVLVREGVVELNRPAIPVVAVVRVGANEHAVAATDAPISVIRETPEHIVRELAWKSGRIAFEDQSLAAAAREFSRYSGTRIVVDDPVVRRRTVTGLFVANDPVGFAKAVAVSLDLNINIGRNEVRLERKL